MKIVTAWAEWCNGPGWINAPIWYLYYEDGRPQVGVIQPEDQTAEMRQMFDICRAANEALVAVVREAVSDGSV